VLESNSALVRCFDSTTTVLVLDEAATVASLDDWIRWLDGQGLDVTLVTVLQDFSQLKARWGPRARTM